jgi:hydroxyacylglutathione hydrolase
MYFQQFYLGCLAHASYLIGSNGQAAVVDPQRDVDQYIEEAKKNSLQISYVIETHLHADFVSGHRELARRTGAKIICGAQANVGFEHFPMREGDEIRMGHVTLSVLETPGHTPESISILVYDEERSKDPVAVLTGDTLFIGDVGRPDLLGVKMSAKELAGMLYDSLHNKLMKLPDSVTVYPAHGAGSMCGRNISKEKSSTIGEQRKFNYALQPMTKEDFINMMTVDLPEAPAYFSKDAEINRQGPPLLEELPVSAALTPQEFEKLAKSGATILDTRPSDQYGTGHIPGSLNVGLEGHFAAWSGTLIPLGHPIIVVAENEEHAEAARLRLARVGHENVAGYLNGGILEWQQAGLPLTSLEQITVDELDRRIKEGKTDIVLDVRRPAEWKAGHIRVATHMPLNHLAETAEQLNRDKSICVICAGGFRSSAATSILEQKGFHRITNVVGGMTAWQNANLETVT